MNSQVITVGVDGSKPSSDALRFAFEEARMRGGTVRAVTAWQADAYYAGYSDTLVHEDNTAHEKAATELQDKALQVVLQGSDEAPLIDRRVVRGHTGQVLIDDQSRDASLLVVGTEHKGLLKRAAQGSTSGYCAKFSKVPVVVVPFVDQELHGRQGHGPGAWGPIY